MRKSADISRFYLGRQQKGGEALAVIEVDSPPDDGVLDEVRAAKAVILVKLVKL